MKTKFRPTNQEELKLFEDEFNISLPEKYKNFIITHNGGRPEKGIFQIQSMDDIGILNWFFGVNVKSNYDLAKHIRDYKEYLPSGIIPVAEDPGGNFICISVEPENRGAVYYWDQEDDVFKGGEPSYKYLHQIAEDFEDFVNNLASPLDSP
ncbi:MAG TPA: SMI1/KNR4 family protein [Roseiflexaceae bacterium]|nr:SMI1/KNR4 family protein [Roseiflexaceae bacterium]